ncbi:RpiR family transcriptional regulator [Enterococcus faecium]|nr:RpiR family transcriptional regulator [Enterococcus faecium]
MLIEEKLTKQELFTTTEKRIADYIRRNIEAAVYMTRESHQFSYQLVSFMKLIPSINERFIERKG